MKEHIVIVGSVALDSITTPFGKINRGVGGSSVYSSLAASFFSPVAIIGVVGADFPGGFLAKLNKKGINTDGIKREPGKTFFWRGKYSWDISTAISLDTQLNVFEKFDPSVPEYLRASKHLFLANIDPVLQKKVLKQMKPRKSGGFTALDTMNFWIEHKREKVKEVIKKIDVLLLNDGEARELFEMPNLSRAGKSALGMGPRAVIIKKGEHGALLFTRAAHFSAPSYPLENVVDPTGCGDCFGGGLTGFLAKTDDVSEWNVRKAMIYGSAIASHNAEGFGLEVLKKISIVDVERRFNEFKSIREF